VFGACAFDSTRYTLYYFPLTFHPSAWYFTQSMVVLTFCVGLTVHGFLYQPLAVGAVFFRFRTSSSAGSPRGQSSQPWLREPASELLLSISRVVALSSKQPVGCRKDQTLYQAQNLKVRRHRSWSRLSSLTALDLAVDASGPTTGPSFSIF
jgi:hypothetical protein